VVLALHGFNDYRNAFASVGPFLAQRGILTYAYDQRGFGATAYRGLWPGTDRLVADARQMLALIRARHPQAPIYLMGDSMGGAVLLAAYGEPEQPTAAGLILIAPAVWARVTMNPLARLGLWLAVRLRPAMTVTGEGLRITASDNREMLRAMGRDPLVIKRTRIDTIAGLTDLMDAALAAAGGVDAPTLILYGEHDEVVPRRPLCRMLETLPATAAERQRVALYSHGYHMLTRDLQASVVLEDIAAWVLAPGAALPSGEEVSPPERAARALCNAAARRR
jgi:alpha-beta hydrolase superfamily lysophospholipase